MTNREELERDLSDRDLIKRHRERVEQAVFGQDKPKPQKAPQKSPSRIKIFLFLLFMQIVLLAVWATLFFILGMLTQYEMIPFLPKLIEALRVLLS